MAKSNIEALVDKHLAEIEAPASKAFALPSWIPEWVLAYAIATALSALKAIAKTDAGKAAVRGVFLRLFVGIKTAYSGDPDFE